MRRPANDPDKTAPPGLTVEAWASIPGLVHAFYGRDGGASRGPWRSLNLSETVGDSAETVAANWARLTRSLGDIRPAGMTQVHGDRVRRIGRRDCSRPSSNVGECDGLLTNEAGCGLTVMTADCVPILLVAPAHRAVMALHAGWRGTLAGIARAGLKAARRSLGIASGEWQAALGPSIGGCCYEVSAEIGDSFERRWGAMPEAWQASGRRGQLDLRRVNTRILEECGIPDSSIHAVGPCTACANQQYFSYRKSGGKTGRQVSLIGFEGEFGVVSKSDDR